MSARPGLARVRAGRAVAGDVEEHLFEVVALVALQQRRGRATIDDAALLHHQHLPAEPLHLHPDKAVSLGVIVNELVSNACKYAYESGAAGEVRIQFGKADSEGRFHLLVEDDGVGMSEDEKPKGSGLGSRLVLAMARSLAAEFDYDRGHAGVRARLHASI